MTRPLLRWLGSLLAGTLFAYVTWLLCSLTLQFALGGQADVPFTGLRWVLRVGIPYAASGAVFVCVGASLAPKHPLRALIAFVAFALIQFVLVLTGVLAVPAGRAWLSPIAALIGAGATSAILRDRDIKHP